MLIQVSFNFILFSNTLRLTLYLANLMMVSFDWSFFLGFPIQWLWCNQHLGVFLAKAHLRYLSQQHWYLYSRSSHPEAFVGVLKICSKFTGEHPFRSAISIKLQSNFIIIPLRNGCSPVNLLHVFRTPFQQNTSKWLLLNCFIHISCLFFQFIGFHGIFLTHSKLKSKIPVVWQNFSFWVVICGDP